jgi:hypothetical protein
MAPAKPRGRALTISRSTKAWPLSAFLGRWGEDSAPSGNEPPPYVATLTKYKGRRTTCV